MTKEPNTPVSAQEPLGRRARKALAVRRALFESGLAAFERQPIGLVSILDITETADVAKGVFYLQFKSKDDYLLALWEEVQSRFLDAARTAVIDCGEQSSRIEIATREFVSFVHNATAATRFWLRMSSYFPDEIGEPGRLVRIRQEYLQQLAALIVGKTVADLSADDVQTALVVDTLCWAVAGAEIQQGEPLLDAQTLVQTVRAALPHFYRDRARENVTSLAKPKSL
jgi:AcrR family transcriptional regulator